MQFKPIKKVEWSAKEIRDYEGSLHMLERLLEDLLIVMFLIVIILINTRDYANEYKKERNYIYGSDSYETYNRESVAQESK